MHVCLVNDLGKNHDILWSTHDVHGDKTKDHYYKIRREYKSAECEEMEQVLLTKM